MGFRRVVLEKFERYNAGQPLRVLDLFSGCGGISLGFHHAGCRIIGAVEFDKDACATHARNFHGALAEADPALYRAHARPRDIRFTEPADLLRELGCTDAPERAVDLIVGGPPCQAFARVGRAKLREVRAHDEAWLKDERSLLYKRYLHFVQILQPMALLMENVPDVLNYGGKNIAEQVSLDLGARYTTRYTLMNAVHYGVPQMRQRMMLVSVASDLGTAVDFPEPTHAYTLPKGYESARHTAVRHVGESPHFMPTPTDTHAPTPAVTLGEAVDDLPILTHQEKNRRGPRTFTRPAPYRGKPHSPYAQLMRTWPGFECRGEVFDQVTRRLPRDWPIFAAMQPGDQYPEALAIAERLFAEALQREADAGRKCYPESPFWCDLRKEIVPPYDPHKFPNKWRKMERDQPARTLMAHLGKDSYSHIHHCSNQARTLTVREAARLQSFPDGFVFEGAMNAAFRQIGNAVPPLMAYHLALAIKACLAEAQVAVSQRA